MSVGKKNNEPVMSQTLTQSAEDRRSAKKIWHQDTVETLCIVFYYMPILMDAPSSVAFQDLLAKWKICLDLAVCGPHINTTFGSFSLFFWETVSEFSATTLGN